MKYLLAFVREPNRMYEGSEEEMRQAMEAWNEFNREAIDAGVLIANEALELPKTAKTVRIGDAVLEPSLLRDRNADAGRRLDARGDDAALEPVERPEVALRERAERDARGGGDHGADG